ncbi:MAG: cation diffusion facilitator family transporter [Melioribacteraceae bacterium]|nr:cation diffusion facilitator family transporter [Melioribacteraceae bacterium]
MSHSHNHHHPNRTDNFDNKFKIGIALNLLFVTVEFIFGLLYDSLALIADAGHNLSDVIGLVLALGASYLVRRKPTENFTYGFKKSSVIGAQLNSLILLVAIGIIVWEAVDRITYPPQVDGFILIIVAGIGVVINGITTYLFIGGKDSDLNIKGAYLHMLADTLISLGVVVSGIIILLTGANWIDPIISILISIIIFWSTWKLLQDATKLSLDAVPGSINIEKVKDYFINKTEINDFHDLHIWALSTTETALTVHLVIDEKLKRDDFIKTVNHDLEHKFGINHSTIQTEEIDCANGC